MHAWTAAHPSLPLGTCVQVVNLSNGRHVDVRINDRGPYVPGRTIDLSYRAARELRMVGDGVTPVRITRAKPEKCVRPTDS
jgi:rare lipoprotein A